MRSLSVIFTVLSSAVAKGHKFDIVLRINRFFIFIYICSNLKDDCEFIGIVIIFDSDAIDVGWAPFGETLCVCCCIDGDEDIGGSAMLTGVDVTTTDILDAVLLLSDDETANVCCV